MARYFVDVHGRCLPWRCRQWFLHLLAAWEAWAARLLTVSLLPLLISAKESTKLRQLINTLNKLNINFKILCVCSVVIMRQDFIIKMDLSLFMKVGFILLNKNTRFSMLLKMPSSGKLNFEAFNFHGSWMWAVLPLCAHMPLFCRFNFWGLAIIKSELRPFKISHYNMLYHQFYKPQWNLWWGEQWCCNWSCPQAQPWDHTPTSSSYSNSS